MLSQVQTTLPLLLKAIINRMAMMVIKGTFMGFKTAEWKNTTIEEEEEAQLAEVEVALALQEAITRIPLGPDKSINSHVYSVRTLRPLTRQKSVEKWISLGTLKNNTIRTVTVIVVVIGAQAEAIIVEAIEVHL